ncbi:MAG: hypothetical protein RJA99_662 [Pseudomonadota bacterium]|jgi:metallo-beta-lactamase class B
MASVRPIRVAVAAVAVAVLGAACGTPSAEKPTQAGVDARVAAAKRLAGDDLAMLMPLCEPQPATRTASGPQVDAMLRKLVEAAAPEPGPVFDNVWFVGSAWVSAWVVRTSDGLVLIDALNNALEARALIEGGMAKLGLDPAQLRYLIVTHGHGDHYGGARYLAEKYRLRVVASEIDWRMMETQLEFSSSVWGAPPQRDIAVKDGEVLTVGDTAFRLYVTPGHTLGTLSPVFDVKSGGRTHAALLWGGTAFNFGRDLGRLEHYAAAADRMRGIVQRQPIDVLMSNHPGWDGTLRKLQAMRAQGGRVPNPFVTGPKAVDRALAVMGECARAQRDRFLM